MHRMYLMITKFCLIITNYLKENDLDCLVSGTPSQPKISKLGELLLSQYISPVYLYEKILLQWYKFGTQIAMCNSLTGRQISFILKIS